jgi:hypothetical protein
MVFNDSLPLVEFNSADIAELLKEWKLKSKIEKEPTK